ncbi:MAG: helix-turn-helix domain containing protein [Armatimonadetes bacterium]|nr:helix-turn-helix domain containing protein [Armatimonadota bacterium]
MLGEFCRSCKVDNVASTVRWRDCEGVLRERQVGNAFEEALQRGSEAGVERLRGSLARHNLINRISLQEDSVSQPPRIDEKAVALRQVGAFSSHPEAVRDPLFHDSDFFDARDLVQVKYEMLRRVRAEGHSVSAAASSFGFSRVSFYQARAAFDGAGLPGLVPRRPGPRGAHKLTDAIVDVLLELRAANPSARAAELGVELRQRLGLSVHPRSIERALARRAKKTPGRLP